MISFSIRQDSEKINVEVSIRHRILLVWIRSLLRYTANGSKSTIQHIQAALPKLLEGIKLVTALILAVTALVGAWLQLVSMIGSW